MQNEIQTSKDTLRGTEKGQNLTTKAGKSEKAYWKPRLRKRTFSRGGETIQISDWQIRLKHRGGEGWFNLHTQNAEDAAKQARDIYLFLMVNGWELTNAKFKPKPKEFSDSPTLGDFFVAVQKNVTLAPKTFASYCRKFRTIVGDIFDLDASHSEKCCPRKSAQWRERVEKVKLADITPKKVEQWRRDFIARAGHNQRKIREAKHSADSAIRCARALFGKNVLRQIGEFPFPNPKPFDGVPVEQLHNPYQSTINPGDLISRAMIDLRLAEPEAFKIFLLCLMVGLRRNEADKLQWSSINWAKPSVTIEMHEWFAGKCQASEATVPVDPKVLKMLEDFKPADGQGFVINSKVKPKPEVVTYTHYRANRHFVTLIRWLRKNQVKGRCPVHTLRKECGKMVTEKRGIYAASKQLRHRDITTTFRYYADDTRATYPELPELTNQANSKAAALLPGDNKPDFEKGIGGEAPLTSPSVLKSAHSDVAA